MVNFSLSAFVRFKELVRGVRVSLHQFNEEEDEWVQFETVSVGAETTVVNLKEPKKFQFNFLFDLKFKIEVFGFLGDTVIDESLNTSVFSILNCNNNVLILPIGANDIGTVRLEATKIKAEHEVLTFLPSGRKLDKMDVGLFAKSDPYFVIHRGDSNEEVYRSGICYNTLNPQWHLTHLPLSSLCDGDLDLPLLFHVYDWDRVGNDDLIGIFQTTVRDLTTRKESFYDIENPGKKKKKNYKHSGEFIVQHSSITTKPSLMDFFQCNNHFDLCFACDFSELFSADGPQDSVLCSYVKMLTKSAPSLLRFIDTEKGGVSAFGYSHLEDGTNELISLSSKPTTISNYQDARLASPTVAGLLEALYETVAARKQYSTRWTVGEGVEVGSRKGLTEVIDVAVQLAETHLQDMEQRHRKEDGLYTVLVVLTTKPLAASGLEPTLKAIIKASHLPLSIVILTPEDVAYPSLKGLDEDASHSDGLLRFAGLKAERDVVMLPPILDEEDPDPLAELADHLEAWLEKELHAA
eukprot:GCRY01002307.1.p1 GENE.GCRY01002307.1~~GCRY01002307.1.p1  ORF type:complete len:522 (+),score=134.22 GCRY01002307.1:110-1675(+)